MKARIWLHVLVLLALMLPSLPGAPVRAQATIYVDWAAEGLNDGTSWTDAYANLQDALDAALGGDEIWVAAGTYKPTDGTDRMATFQLKSGVAVYGGFPAGGGTWQERNWVVNSTRLSGNIGSEGEQSDNVYHVVTSIGVGADAILDGFWIEGGYANGTVAPHDSGGGVYNQAGSPTIRNVKIVGNYAGTGGGMYNSSGSSPMLANVTFMDNDAAWGGGLSNAGQSSPMLVNATFFGNSASVAGGGMHSALSYTLLVNAVFSGNVAGERGGGLANDESDAELINVTLSGNLAAEGGAIYNYASRPILTNCILWGNTAPLGAQIQDNASKSTITYSDVQGSWLGKGNIDIDPEFVREPHPGTDGLWGTSDDDYGDLHLNLSSWAIDSGSNAALPADTLDMDGDRDTLEPMPVDLAGHPRIRFGTVDMGAYEAGPDNDTWTRAQEIVLAPTGDGLQAQTQEYVDRLGQSRWYKFQVSPGSRVAVELIPGAADYDLTLFKDIEAAFEDLVDPQDLKVEDLTKITAKFAPDAYSPDAYSPDAYSPDAYAPDAYSPDAYSPDAYSPDAYSPDAYSPDAYSPDAYSPDAYSPDAYSPDAYSPDAYSPDAYSPDAYSPDEAYTAAQLHSLIGISAFDGAASELIVSNTWDNTGYFYARVRGRNGAFDVDYPFTLIVTQQASVCEGIPPNPKPTHLVPEANDYHTLVLVDWARMDTADPLWPTLETKLQELAASVEGIVIDVGTDESVSDANAQADSNPGCPYAKNLVARAIKQIIDAYRALNPLEYVVIVGNDDVIPFYRHPDRALLASEKNYMPPVIGNTASYASLALGYVLSQDFYGSSLELPLKNTILPIPGLAVGRLVETPADIIAVLDAFAAKKGTMPKPKSALVTGYDFLTDAADRIKSELEQAGIRTVDTLIAERDVSPLDPEAWVADDLRSALLGSRHDLIFLAGHFSASSALAADYSSRILATEVANSTVDLQNALIYSPGCHSGYNIVNHHGIPYLTREPDWAQVFARKGATFVGGTGYQYGDTDFLEYSERLYLEFTRQLRCSGEPMPIGRALVQAKQAYLAGTAQMRGIHEKALLEATLFGLPMIEMPRLSADGCPTAESSMVTGTTAYTTEPGASLGLEKADTEFEFILSENVVTLYNVDPDHPNTSIDAIYFLGPDGVVANPGEPVLPLDMRNVSVDNMVLRGIGFRGGSYLDAVNNIPLTAAPTTEVRGVPPPFVSDVLFPIQPWGVNYFDTLAKGASGSTQLALTPAQFVSGGTDLLRGTWRRFFDMQFRLFYSANTTIYKKDAVPALSAPPVISKVLASSDGERVAFRATVLGDPAAGIQEVWVTYTTCDGTTGCLGSWESLDLSRHPEESTLWVGTLPLNGTPAEDVRYVVQAVNGVGLVALVSNLGEYYRIGFDPADPSAGGDPASPPRPAVLKPVSLPDSGQYSTEVPFSVQLTSDRSPVSGQRVKFALGAQQRWATTDDNGLALVEIPLLGSPGKYRLRVSFAGSTEYQPAILESPFTIHKRDTQLSLSLSLVGTGELIQLIAELTDADGGPLREKAVIFIITTGGTSYAASAVTDYFGRAPLDEAFLPVGGYLATVYFGAIVPLPDGTTLDLTDVNYEPAIATTDGYATGGGWIASPAGAYPADPAVTGEGSFGFIANLKDGAETPTGETEFHLKAGNLNFHSVGYDWLTAPSPLAVLKGSGTINGQGDYGFLLSAIDADLVPTTDVDLFRIKIWDGETGQVVYDSQMGAADDALPSTPIGGGSIVIHPGE